MANVNIHGWKILNVKYRVRFLFYQLFGALEAKDRGTTLKYAGVVKVIRNGDDEMLPALAMDPTLVQRVADILIKSDADEEVVKVLAGSLKATLQDKEARTLTIAKSEVEDFLLMYDEFLKMDLKEKGNLGKMGTLQYLTDIIDALENAKAGKATDGIIEKIPDLGEGNSETEALPDGEAKAKALPEPAAEAASEN